jgi:predicted lipid-binding transport protein (Tim44 family)
METINLFTLILLIVAVVVILKLRSVLGRRTGDEEARLERYRAERRQQGTAPAPTDNVVAMPRRDREGPMPQGSEVALADAEERIKDYPGIDAEVRNGLLDVAKLDPAFDPEAFVRGAKAAYEMIVTAFAEGNRKILKDLLSRDVYDGFTRAITEREGRGEQVDQSFVGINKAEIVESEVKSGIANVTVRFVSQLISATRDKAGAILSGDPQRIKDVTDIWTFRRDISSVKMRANPNWELVATQSPS